MQQTSTALIGRARSLLGKGIIYKLGQGGRNPALTPAQLAGSQLDCSGFVAWCLGFDRYITNPFYAAENGENGRGWFETTAAYKDANNGGGILTRIAAPVPGCIVVYGDSTVGGVHTEGHIGIVTEVGPGGTLQKAINCSSSAYRHFNDAITENASPFINNPHTLFAKCDAFVFY